jgi:8-oxo-dGTP diphosphatase
MPTDQVIRAAGGLLWRETSTGWEVALVNRQRYQDWSLPKGKLKPGESWLQAAIREVIEETGYAVQLGGFAGIMMYEVEGRVKLVRYWHMLATTLIGEPHPEEISQVEWLPIEQARKQSSYYLEQALLQSWDSPTQTSE